MPRLTAAQLAYGTLTVVVATTLLLAASGAGSLPAVLGTALTGLALGGAVAFGVRRTQGGAAGRARRAVEPFLATPVAPVHREREHSFSR